MAAGEGRGGSSRIGEGYREAASEGTGDIARVLKGVCAYLREEEKETSGDEATEGHLHVSLLETSQIES